MSKSLQDPVGSPVPFATTLHVRDHCLCLHVQRAARRLARLFDEALRPVGLTNQQFSLLMSLNRPEPPTIGPVAELLGMNRTTLTAALKPLERRGLVDIAPGKEDRRSRRLAITKEGIALLAAAMPIWRRVHETLDERLAQNGTAELRQLLQCLA
jgi:DNA-binding MarR family transcriptional regulator